MKTTYPKRHDLCERLWSEDPRKVATPYGMVTVARTNVILEASEDEVYDWAHRPGAAWPCSTLTRVTRSYGRPLHATLWKGDLVDIEPASRGHRWPTNWTRGWMTSFKRHST